jgi:hypothetical protein
MVGNKHAKINHNVIRNVRQRSAYLLTAAIFLD